MNTEEGYKGLLSLNDKIIMENQLDEMWVVK